MMEISAPLLVVLESPVDAGYRPAIVSGSMRDFLMVAVKDCGFDIQDTKNK